MLHLKPKATPSAGWQSVWPQPVGLPATGAAAKPIRPKRLLPVLAILVLLAMPAAAQGFETGFQAAQRGDFAAALREWRPLAEQGQAAAQTNLGIMYAEGQGVAQDPVLAHMWFNLAAAQGDENAVNFRDVAAGRMTPAEVAEAQALARAWHAEHGH